MISILEVVYITKFKKRKYRKFNAKRKVKYPDWYVYLRLVSYQLKYRKGEHGWIKKLRKMLDITKKPDISVG